MVVFIYGGQPPGDWHLREECLPKGWVCVVCAAGSPPGGHPLPSNFLLAPADAYTPDLVKPSGPHEPLLITRQSLQMPQLLSIIHVHLSQTSFTTQLHDIELLRSKPI